MQHDWSCENNMKNYKFFIINHAKNLWFSDHAPKTCCVFQEIHVEFLPFSCSKWKRHVRRKLKILDFCLKKHDVSCFISMNLLFCPKNMTCHEKNIFSPKKHDRVMVSFHDTKNHSDISFSPGCRGWMIYPSDYLPEQLDYGTWVHPSPGWTHVP